MILIVYLDQHKYLFIYLFMCLLMYGLFNSAFINLVNQVLNDWMKSVMIWKACGGEWSWCSLE